MKKQSINELPSDHNYKNTFIFHQTDKQILQVIHGLSGLLFLVFFQAWGKLEGVVPSHIAK